MGRTGADNHKFIYERLCDWSRGIMAQGGTQDWRSLLDRYLYDISVALQNSIDDISMQLKEDFAACEYAEIDSIPNKMRKVEKVVISVRSRDLETFNKFCDALEKTGHKALAIKLRGTVVYLQHDV